MGYLICDPQREGVTTPAVENHRLQLCLAPGERLALGVHTHEIFPNQAATEQQSGDLTSRAFDSSLPPCWVASHWVKAAHGLRQVGWLKPSKSLLAKLGKLALINHQQKAAKSCPKLI